MATGKLFSGLAIKLMFSSRLQYQQQVGKSTVCHHAQPNRDCEWFTPARRLEGEREQHWVL